MTSSASANPAPKSIVVWGGGGHGHVVADLLRVLGGWDVVGFLDNRNPPGARIMGVPVLGDADQLPRFREQGVAHVAVAIGDPAARADMLARARALGFDMPTLVHPSCVVSPTAVVGPACVLCAGAVVGPGTVLGTGVIVNTRASVDHDVRLGDFAHVAPGATVCGFVEIGRATWIGAGAVVRDHLALGERVMVGAGAVVLQDVPDGLTVFGCPAKPQPQERPA
ncbi:MAG TPA: acetyltransferase [Kiritimatiellia bacterium]|nr:acetyltransferase [Kiritimatiellia bacterium]HRT05052.1 acetyltransferase [Kiritimatiellia bacterium]